MSSIPISEAKIVVLDDEYNNDVKQAHEVYFSRIQEADELMAKVTVDDFVKNLLSNHESTPKCKVYEQLAGQELTYNLKAAACRLAMRQLKNK